jgi:hypothetical protein
MNLKRIHHTGVLRRVALVVTGVSGGGACGLRRRGGGGGCWGPTSGRGASVCRLLVAACVVPGSPVLIALVGGGGAFLRGVGSCGGRAAQHPEDAVLLCYISFLTSFSFFSVSILCGIYI